MKAQELRPLLLAIEESAVRRERLRAMLNADPRIEVLGILPDPQLAADRIQRRKPDAILLGVATLDPQAGTEAHAVSKYGIPVVLVSHSSRPKLARHWAAGTVVLADKAEGDAVCMRDLFAVLTRIGARTLPGAMSALPRSLGAQTQLIAIGASTGGTAAIESILDALAPPLPPVVITQHISPRFATNFARRLNQVTAFTVSNGLQGGALQPDHVYVAPGDAHMVIERTAGKLCCALKRTARVNGHCPSVDVMFDSVARQMGPAAMGILLTGMGNDGANGLLAIARGGGTTIVQDRQSSVVWSMPEAAIRLGAAQHTVALQEIPAVLREHVRRGCGTQTP